MKFLTPEDLKEDAAKNNLELPWLPNNLQRFLILQPLSSYHEFAKKNKMEPTFAQHCIIPRPYSEPNEHRQYWLYRRLFGERDLTLMYSGESLATTLNALKMYGEDKERPLIDELFYINTATRVATGKNRKLCLAVSGLQRKAAT